MRRLLRIGHVLAASLAGAPALALCLLLPAVPPASADQTDPRLAPLFDILKTTRNPIEAQVVEHEIWSLWMTSNEETVNLLMIRGVDALSADDLKTAFKVFTEMVEIAPDFAEGWNKRATVLYMLGAYPESIADIDRTLELEPRHFGALSGLGLCNAELEHDEAALDAFERALTVNPHMDGARVNAELLRRKIEDKAI
jgi:tetratricopeptide (TPR) repeat protein